MTRTTAGPRTVWTPSAESIASTNIGAFTRWLREERGIEVGDYDAMWRWSIGDLDGFWRAIWDFYAVGAPVEPGRGLVSSTMPGAVWFPDARVNLAAHILRPRSCDDAVAVVGVGETGSSSSLSWAELRDDVAALTASMKGLGVVKGDVVAGYLPNIAETVVAFLATASLGAIWSAVGQEYSVRAVADRFAQLEPVLLFAADGHVFNGHVRDRRESVERLRAELPTVRDVIGVSRLGETIEGAIGWSQVTAQPADFAPADTAFSDPLWVLFSSGTTGLPKGIVHSHGGVLLEQLKMMGFHLDLKVSDRFTWYTSPSWVVWNCLVGGMACAGSVLCYDGAPGATGPATLWGIVAEHEVTVFGTSPGYLAATQDAGVRPAAEYDLAALRIMGSTGAPLPERAYDYVADEVGPIPLFSMSGGTDIASAFAMGSPNVPVWAGEIPVRGLGVSLESLSDSGTPLVGQVGELVVTKPMPSMPVAFWNDPDGSRYRAAYFETFPGIWRHGDWITLTERGSLVVHGRSDSTLNRNGVRMGSADIYAAVESMDEIAEALVIGAEEADGGYWMPLFVVMQPGHVLDARTVAAIKERVRDRASPRHVPDEVIAVRGIPHTRTGKKLEVPVKRLIQGIDYGNVVDPTVIDDDSLMGDFRELAARRLAAVHSAMVSGASRRGAG
jgi:acetoacetyl-CoA synthetase